MHSDTVMAKGYLMISSSRKSRIKGWGFIANPSHGVWVLGGAVRAWCEWARALMRSLHMCSHPCSIAGSPGRAEWEVFMAKSPVLTQPNTAALLRAAPGAGSHPNPIGSFWRCCLFAPWQVQRTLQAPANLRAHDITVWVPEEWSQSSLCLNRVGVAKMLFRLEGVN